MNDEQKDILKQHGLPAAPLAPPPDRELVALFAVIDAHDQVVEEFSEDSKECYARIDALRAELAEAKAEVKRMEVIIADVQRAKRWLPSCDPDEAGMMCTDQHDGRWLERTEVLDILAATHALEVDAEVERLELALSVKSEESRKALGREAEWKKQTLMLRAEFDLQVKSNLEMVVENMGLFKARMEIMGEMGRTEKMLREMTTSRARLLRHRRGHIRRTA